MPPPIIPQTVEQARQRDQLAGLDSGMAPDPAHELAVLRNAVRAHRDAIKNPRSVDPDTADYELWQHIEEESQP
jgi:hypothetical protein